MRVDVADSGPWVNWLWAWQNPHPEKAVAGVRFEPVAGAILVSAIAAGSASSMPLLWRARRKAVLALPAGETFVADLDGQGLLQQVQLDMGQVISATLRPLYPNEGWETTYNNQVPVPAEGSVLIEYTAHPDACLHVLGGYVIPVARLEAGRGPVLYERWRPRRSGSR